MVPTGNKPLPEPMLTQNHVTIGHNELHEIYIHASVTGYMMISMMFTKLRIIVKQDGFFLFIKHYK